MPQSAAVAPLSLNIYNVVMGAKAITLSALDDKTGRALSRLANARTIHEVISNALDDMPTIVPADGLAVFLFENGSVNILPRGIPDDAVSYYLSLPVGSDPLLGRMHETRQPVHEGHLFCTKTWREHDLYQGLISPFGFEHYLITPLVDRSGIAGALAFARRRTAGAFAENELTAVAMTTAYVSVAMAYCKRVETSTLACMSSLTSRESLISTFVAKGLSNGEIAEQLQISENTVKKHLKVMFARLGVSRRAELAWLATLAGVV